MSNTAYLLLGSNRGNRLFMISKALVEINKRIGVIIKRSSLYETEPWGFEDETFFVNFLIAVSTELDPEILLKEIKEIETILGRFQNAEQNESRNIDIDIIFYNNNIFNNEILKIPHPLITQRRFVLTPLNEIIPNFVHPIEKKTIFQLLSECKDNRKVRRFNFVNR
jgi:2-amino-4-hydroxy-6-hydroxymethyldihydropteridine diphosphokinase